MHDPTQQQQSTRAATRGTFTAFGARHVQGVAVFRWVAAICFVLVGALLLEFGHWWGVVYFLAAGVNGTLAYLVPRWNPPGDAHTNAEVSA